MEICYKVYKPQSWEKKKKRKEKTLIIFVYQVQILALTKPSSILVPSYRGFGFASNN
jgi:hypothetical protein